MLDTRRTNARTWPPNANTMFITATVAGTRDPGEDATTSVCASLSGLLSAAMHLIHKLGSLVVPNKA
jgi:hypothetical protein